MIGNWSKEYQTDNQRLVSTYWNTCRSLSTYGDMCLPMLTCIDMLCVRLDTSYHNIYIYIVSTQLHILTPSSNHTTSIRKISKCLCACYEVWHLVQLQSFHNTLNVLGKRPLAMARAGRFFARPLPFRSSTEGQDGIKQVPARYYFQRVWIRLGFCNRRTLCGKLDEWKQNRFRFVPIALKHARTYKDLFWHTMWVPDK